MLAVCTAGSLRGSAAGWAGAAGGGCRTGAGGGVSALGCSGVGAGGARAHPDARRAKAAATPRTLIARIGYPLANKRPRKFEVKPRRTLPLGPGRHRAHDRLERHAGSL